MVRKIILFPNVVLMRKTLRVADFNLRSFCDHVVDLRDTLDAMPNALAIASNQISEHPFQVFVTRPCEAFPGGVIINPKWSIDGDHDSGGDPAEKDVRDEGCLSFPGIYRPIKRYKRIYATYQALDESHKTVFLDGLEARMFQHECDHLNGRVFIADLSAKERSEIRVAMIKRKWSGRR